MYHIYRLCPQEMELSGSGLCVAGYVMVPTHHTRRKGTEHLSLENLLNKTQKTEALDLQKSHTINHSSNQPKVDTDKMI